MGSIFRGSIWPIFPLVWTILKYMGPGEHVVKCRSALKGPSKGVEVAWEKYVLTWNARCQRRERRSCLHGRKNNVRLSCYFPHTLQMFTSASTTFFTHPACVYISCACVKLIAKFQWFFFFYQDSKTYYGNAWRRTPLTSPWPPSISSHGGS